MTLTHLTKVATLFTLIGGVLLSTFSCSKEKQPLEFTFMLLDDYATIMVPESERKEFTKIITLSRERMEEIATLFDAHNPDSEVSRINRLSEHVRFPISFETSRILRFAKTYHEQSEGVFDVSIFPLAYMWGFHGGVPPGKVSGDVISASVSSVGLKHIGIYEKAIELNSPFSRLDLSGLMEGYLVDLAILRLRNNNFRHVFIQYGNSIRSLGTDNEGQPWKVEVPHPYQADTAIGYLTLKTKIAASYSYIYGETIDNEGEQVTHIIDPRTGQPSDDTVYALAIGPTGHMTDALSTTLTIQGIAGAPAMLNNFDERCEALLIPNQKPVKIWVSEKMLDYFSPTAEFKNAIQIIPAFTPKSLEKVINPKLKRILDGEEADDTEYVPLPKSVQKTK